MTKRVAPTTQTTYSIAEARNQFTTLIRTVEQEKRPLKVVRHGRPVAIILSFTEYERLLGEDRQRNFDQAYKAFRAERDQLTVENEDDIWEQVRDRSPALDRNPWL